MNPEDILLILAPPLRLVDYIERLFDAKRGKGEEIPANWLKWLERWKAIRSELPSDIDYITVSEWDALTEKVF